MAGPSGFNTGVIVLLDSVSEIPLTRSRQFEYEVTSPANMLIPVGHTSTKDLGKKKKIVVVTVNLTKL